MRILAAILFTFLGLTPLYAADQFEEMLSRQAAIDKFVWEAPLFIKDKSLTALRKLAPLKFEEVYEKPNPHVPGENIEYKGLDFDGLSIFGEVKNQSELAPIHIIITDKRWQILKELNVGTNIERIEQVLGKATYEYGNTKEVKEYKGETNSIIFHTEDTSIKKIELVYYAD